MRRISLKSVIQYLLFLGLGLGLIWYSLKDLTPDQVSQLKGSWKQARFLYLIPVVLVMLLSHFSRSLRWIILMKPLGYKPSITNTYLAVLLGYFFNMLVPRLGEVMKCTLLAKYEKVAPDKLVGTIVAERAVDFVSLMLLAVVMVIVQFDRIGAYTIETFSSLIKSKGGEISGAKTMLVVLILGFLIFLVRRILHKYRENKMVIKTKAIGLGIWEGIKSLKYIQNKGAFIFHSIFIWAMYLMGIWMGFLAFPPVAHLGFQASVSILVFGSLGMIATQGGIGAYQIAVEKTLVRFAIPNVMGLAFGWLLWASQAAIVILSGILALLLFPFVNSKKMQD
ncbi:MAG TPA: lysylphosphatidylglycerol synthase transmembrane domain-containing protein [Phnomibacter sp.]|nr:lysylphosphatidylglycerol synthase transmembrane domain-containing protein [Phnomibacter sp.]